MFSTKNQCLICGRSSIYVPKVLGICPDCAREGKGIEHSKSVHTKILTKRKILLYSEFLVEF